MDKKGYKAYLESLGNQNHQFGRIHELIEMEHQLGIDIDDFIPYDGDYNKADELTKLMPEDMLHNERLAFAINSYMRYRLSGFEPKAHQQTSNTSPCPITSFQFTGTRGELKKSLMRFMSDSDAELFLNEIPKFKQHIQENETATKSPFLLNAFPAFGCNAILLPGGFLNLLLGESVYNINISSLTLVAIALLLDIKLTLGFASAALAIIGFNGQAIAKIDVSEGEMCLILEAMHNKKRFVGLDVFSECHSECVHNDLKCKYRSEDTCKMNESQIKKTLDSLCEKNIFRKIGELYKYNF